MCSLLKVTHKGWSFGDLNDLNLASLASYSTSLNLDILRTSEEIKIGFISQDWQELNITNQNSTLRKPLILTIISVHMIMVMDTVLVKKEPQYVQSYFTVYERVKHWNFNL